MIEYVTKHYAEPHRHYHNLWHVLWMLDFAKQNKVKVSQELHEAIIYHDAVYAPFNDTNEEQSASLYVQHFREHRREEHDEHIKKVLKLIMATKKCQGGESHDERLIVELDTAILAANDFTYRCVYAHGILREFTPLNDRTRVISKDKAVEVEQYRIGRSKFLNTVLEKAERRELFALLPDSKDMNRMAASNAFFELQGLTRTCRMRLKGEL